MRSRGKTEDKDKRSWVKVEWGGQSEFILLGESCRKQLLSCPCGWATSGWDPEPRHHPGWGLCASWLRDTWPSASQEASTQPCASWHRCTWPPCGLRQSPVYCATASSEACAHISFVLFLFSFLWGSQIQGPANAHQIHLRWETSWAPCMCLISYRHWMGPPSGSAISFGHLFINQMFNWVPTEWDT